MRRSPTRITIAKCLPRRPCRPPPPAKQLSEKWRRPAAGQVFRTRFRLAHPAPRWSAMSARAGSASTTRWSARWRTRHRGWEGLNKAYGTEILASGEGRGGRHGRTASCGVPIDRIVAAGTTEQATRSTNRWARSTGAPLHAELLAQWGGRPRPPMARAASRAALALLPPPTLSLRPGDGPSRVFHRSLHGFPGATGTPRELGRPPGISTGNNQGEVRALADSCLAGSADPPGPHLHCRYDDMRRTWRSALRQDT